MAIFIENNLERAVMGWFQDLGYQTQYGRIFLRAAVFLKGNALETWFCTTGCIMH